jgi:ferredoxin-NADP reductase
MFTQIVDPDPEMANIQPIKPVSPVRRFLGHPLWAPLNQAEAWSRLATRVNPAWSLTEVRGRVVRVVDEAPGVRSVWLRPNRRFAGFRPGQHLLLELEINGARQSRCFSLSAAPRSDGLLRLTIKRKPDGPVSGAAHALRPGQVVRLGRAQGEFAPREGNGPLLLVGSGSGITPMISLLHGLADAGSRREVVLLQSARGADELILADEIEPLQARLPSLRCVRHLSRESGRLDESGFAALVGDWRDREALVCGPDGLMAMLEGLYARERLADLLQTESFGRRAAPVDPDAASHAVLHAASGTVFEARAGQNLLDAAEAAGLAPRFGCRRGICRTCQCTKRSGTVLNQLTGQVSGPGEELIQLCISTPYSAVELAP